MQIRNFKHGVQVDSPLPPPVPGSLRKKFYWKNLARLSFIDGVGFSIFDPTEYQPTATFTRAEVTLIEDGGLPVPVPGTDQELFTLLSNYFYEAAINSVPTKPEIVDVSGAALLFNEGDSGKVFLSSLPAANKIYTLPAGLSKGWNVEVYKGYLGNSLTFAPGPGMTLFGASLALTAQFSKMKVLYFTPTTAILNVTL